MLDIDVSRIAVFPIKSLDGVSVQETKFVAGGALEHDREFALYDEAGRWINGKRDPRINLIRTEYDLHNLTVRVKSAPETEFRTFHMVEERHELEGWFTRFFGIPVILKRDQEAGFPDDSHAGGPTIIGRGTIIEVGAWFGIADENETRRRFRANIELSSDCPFWEDQLFGPPRQEIAFSLGDVEILGVGPCKRCVVPVRDSMTGEETPDFQKTFNAKRAATLPAWSNRLRFGPLLYRLAVNTRVNASEAGKHLRVGDRFRSSLAQVSSSS